MELTHVGLVEKIGQRASICYSHPQHLLEKVKTVGQGCNFHGSYAAIPGTPSFVLEMRHILLTKGLLQSHSRLVIHDGDNGFDLLIKVYFLLKRIN